MASGLDLQPRLTAADSAELLAIQDIIASTMLRDGADSRLLDSAAACPPRARPLLVSRGLQDARSAPPARPRRWHLLRAFSAHQGKNLLVPRLRRQAQYAG